MNSNIFQERRTGQTEIPDTEEQGNLRLIKKDRKIRELQERFVKGQRIR